MVAPALFTPPGVAKAMRTSQTTPPAKSNSAGVQRTGLGGAAGQQRLPVPPRERKPALAALAVLLILCGALASAYLVMASGQRVSAIQINQPVAAGQQIPVSALAEVQIGNTGISYISWSERFKVVQAFASVPLVKGALLTNGMLNSTAAAAQGRLIVGLALKSGQLPASGLRVGDHVSLYAVGGTNTSVKPGTVLSDDAIVSYTGSSGGAGSRSLSSETSSVSVAIPPEQAPQVTQAASSGSVAVALLPSGVKVNKAQVLPPDQSTAPGKTTSGTGRQTGPSGGTKTGG
ncbi:MAG: hypothetical protein JWN52_4831 [Actinomycetia bacterium]|jgi:hypothetical protein|nr:hypothetical protein [Actinomycetes bacterium]